MSIKGGASKTSGSSNQTENINQTTTTTPNVPSWISDLTQSFGLRLPGATTTVPGLSGLQQDAVDGLSGQNFGQGFSQAAANAGASSAVGSADEGVNHWLNTFLPGVVDATSADLDANDAKTRTQQTLDLARSGAFGGSGAALARSATEGELERARASVLGNLRMGAYDAAANNSQQDQSRALQSKIADQNAAAQQANLMLQALGIQANLGGTQRDVEAQQANSNITDLNNQIGLLGQLPLGLLTGSTSNTTGTNTAQGSTKGSSVGVSAGFTYGGK